MSDWTDTLDARRAGLVEGFHDAGGPIEEEPDEQAQAMRPAALEEALLERVAHLEAQLAERDQPDEPAPAPKKRAAAKKAAAKKPSAAKNVAKMPSDRVIK